MMDDTISRQALLAEMKDMYRAAEKWKDEATTDDAKARAESCMATLIEMKLRAENLPSAQQWHVITNRPMTEEEREAWTEWVQTFGWDDDGEYPHVFENLPKIDDVVLICTKQGFIHIDTYCHDDVEGGYFYEHDDLEDIVAWMPLPEPYKGGDDADKPVPD